MSYSVGNLVTDIGTVVHGTTTNKIPNLYGIINRAARAVVGDVDPKETQRIVQLGQVYNDVFDYPCPVDLKEDCTVDLRPQAGRVPSDVWNQTYAQIFDVSKGVNVNQLIYTQWNTGEKTLRIEAPTLTAPVTITDTGTIQGWSTTTGASNISLDTNYNVAGGGAIQFDLLAGSTTGYVQNSTLTDVDLSSHENISTLFLWVFMPDASVITNVNLQWGSSTSNYWTYTATVTQQNTTFVDGWNLIAFPWVDSTVVGSPDSSLIDFVRVTPTYNSILQTGFKVDNLTSALGFIFELQYYSKYIFRNPVTNVFQETVTDVTDNSIVINLDTSSYNLLFNKCAFFVAQTLQGADAEYDADYWQTEYEKELAKYKARNPSEKKEKAQSYYTLPNKSYARYQSYMYRRA